MPPDDLNVKIGILHVDSDEPVSHLNLGHNSLQHQHRELLFVKEEFQMTQVQNECPLIWFKISQTNLNKPGLLGKLVL